MLKICTLKLNELTTHPMAKTKKTGSSKKVTPAKSKKTLKKTAAKVIKTSAKKKALKKKPTKKKGETLECFLTTACVNYYNLPDQGYELSTLRNYRDTYLASSSAGNKLIQEYYTVSPKIVALVNEDPEKKTVYEFIYSKVQKACAEIEMKKFLSAKKVYVGLVRSLMKRYNMV